MDEQRKLRNLLSYTKSDSVEELEDVNKLYNDLNDYINKSQKEHELFGLYKTLSKLLYDGDYNSLIKANDVGKQILQLEKEIEEMKHEL